MFISNCIAKNQVFKNEIFNNRNILLQVSYISDLTPQQFVNIPSTNIVLTNLSSGVQYSIVVTAITETDGRIDSDTVTGRTCTFVDIFVYIVVIIIYSKSGIFQIRLTPIANCEEWTVSYYANTCHVQNFSHNHIN